MKKFNKKSGRGPNKKGRRWGGGRQRSVELTSSRMLIWHWRVV